MLDGLIPPFTLLMIGPLLFFRFLEGGPIHSRCMPPRYLPLLIGDSLGCKVPKGWGPQLWAFSPSVPREVVLEPVPPGACPPTASRETRSESTSTTTDHAECHRGISRGLCAPR